MTVTGLVCMSTDCFTVCPCCSNTLTVSRSASSVTYPEGQNRLECRSCPYEFLIDRRYYEKKEMKRKEVDDVMGEDAWKNSDQTEAQCPREGCDGARAAFHQVQIRSADEPMTTFYKVIPPLRKTMIDRTDLS